MAYKTLARQGAKTVIPVGFSFTTLFFGLWPSLLRGNAGYAFLIFMVEMLVISIFFALGQFSTSIAAILFALVVGTRVFFAIHRNGEMERFFKSRGWTCPDEQDSCEGDNYVR